ncbi:hypothetical protein NKG94_50910 [Micromonospora sp. M12]
MLDAAALQNDAIPAVRDGGVYVGYPGQSAEAVRRIQIKSVVTQPDGAALGELLQLAADGLLQLRMAGTVPSQTRRWHTPRSPAAASAVAGSSSHSPRPSPGGR